MDPVTAPELVIDAGPVAVLDGHHGVGQVLTARAAEEALRRAGDHGVGAVVVRNSNHFGTAAYFTRMAPPAGTNPWSIAAPAGRHGIVVMDIANTAAARGKIYLARQNKTTIPPGWALNADGQPTNDAQEAIDGVILPMAGHKGYAISFMMDVLSGVLTGSAFGSRVGGPYQTEQRSGAGHLYLALHVAAFMPVEEFGARMEDLIAEVKSVPRAVGFDEIFYPGELEARVEERHRGGLTLPEQTTTDLGKLADQTGGLSRSAERIMRRPPTGSAHTDGGWRVRPGGRALCQARQEATVSTGYRGERHGIGPGRIRMSPIRRYAGPRRS